jgi:acetyltransferase
MNRLDKLFNPKTIAIIGASEEANTVGRGLTKNIIENNASKKVFMVNPNEAKVFGVDCIDRIQHIKEKIDLAVVIVPGKVVLSVVGQCCEKKVGSLIIISNGFGEEGEEGKKKEEEIKKMVRAAGIPLVGPNCLGIMNVNKGLNASFAPVTPKKGNIAFLSQSGALLDSILCMSAAENFGFSKIVSYGNEADLDLCDFLEYLKDDKDTDVICVYLEGIKDGKRFMTVAKKVTAVKPVIAIKSGRSNAGKEAAMTHTGSLAGDYKVYEAAMKQTGVILVDTLEELFDSSKALAWCPRCGNGVGIVTNGGGLGVLTVDYCSDFGIIVPQLKPETLNYLSRQKPMAAVESRHNPLDVIGDALSDRYAAGIEGLLRQDDIYAAIVISTPQIMTEHEKNAKIIVELKKKYPAKAIITCFVGGELTKTAAGYLEDNHIPNYPDPKRAVKSIKNLIIWQK